VIDYIEELQIMRTLGRNMAFFLKCKDAGIKSGVAFPEREKLHSQVSLDKGGAFP
jgi:hypothetical protein